MQPVKIKKKRKSKRRRTDTSFTTDTSMASNHEEYESKSVLKSVASEVKNIQKEMQITRNVFLDAMSKMKEKMNDILHGLVEKLQTDLVRQIDGNAGDIKKQNDRMLTIEKDVR